MIFLIIGLSVLLFLSLVGAFLAPFLVAKHLYFKWFVRDTPEKFPRACSLPSDKNQMAMYAEGMAFSAQSKAKQTPVSITQDGLHLAGIFMDYGRRDCVIIYPGRAETVNYSYYFAEIYDQSSYNVLLIDPRCFGLSEGKYVSAGIKEKLDLLAWSVFAHETLHQERILFHGVCIGGATSLMALNEPSCPDYILGAIAEGPFSDFQKMFRCHTVHDGHPSFPVVNMLPFFFQRYAKVNIKKDCPRNKVSQIRKPVLILQGKEDVFSPWQDTEELYEKCSSEDKHIIYFEHGPHSHLRQFNREAYDRDVSMFAEALHG